MIEIPFMPEFKEKLLNREKIATTRTKKYGKAGEHFIAFDHEFILVYAERVYLQDVVSTSCRLEGFNSQPEFIEAWKKLHPKKGYVPDQKVWFHRFKLIGGEYE